MVLAATRASAGDGFVGVYADSLATLSCFGIPSFTSATLYVIAKTEGATASGITGAEFRIEVPNPNGWIISYTPPPTSQSIGNPLDTDPDPAQGGGTNVSFPSCREPTSGGLVRLGTLSIFNFNGSPTYLLVKRHTRPSNAQLACPLFVHCDSPEYSTTCMTTGEAPSCLIQKNIASSTDDPIVFLGAVENQFIESSLTPLDSVSAEARAMRENAIASGMSEPYLAWHTPAEVEVRNQSMPAWMKKISTMILDRKRLLEEKGVLLDGHRHEAVQYSTPLVPIDNLARVKVECSVSDMTPFDAEYFGNLGGQLLETAPQYGLFTAWMPVAQLQTLAGRPEIKSIQNLPPIVSNQGSVTTQGDQAHRADLLRLQNVLSGAGQTVGVISGGAVSWEASRSTFDLPFVLKTPTHCYDPGGNLIPCLGTGDEGTAMLEIVHDIAYQAELAFCTYGYARTTMVNAIGALRSPPISASIIVDDVGFLADPVFEDGITTAAKKSAVENGVFYVASAGNRAKQHYQGFYSSINQSLCQSNWFGLHNFGSGVVSRTITVQPNTSGYIVLQWSDRFGASSNDFNLYLMDSNGCVILQGTNPQSGTQDPIEIIPFQWPGAQAEHFYIVIDYGESGSPSGNVFFDLRTVPIGDLNGVIWQSPTVAAGSVDGGSRAPEIYTVGEVDAATPSIVGAHSSRGPVRHFYPVDKTWSKPDGVAANNVSITGAGGFPAAGCQPNCRFTGTSASAPHVAGIAALLREAAPGATPSDLATALNKGATDIYPYGQDNDSGSGFIDAVTSLQRLCEPLAQGWMADGIPIARGAWPWAGDGVSDGDQGAIVLMVKGELYGQLAAQRIRSDGRIAWCATGVKIAQKASGSVMVSDGAGGAIVAWHSMEPSTLYEIFMQRINSYGSLLWGEDGIQVPTAWASPGLDMIEDGSGGALLCWDGSGVTPGWSSIQAQRVNSSGISLWQYNGVTVNKWTQSDEQYPSICSDGAGGMIAVWASRRHTGSASWDLYAQRVDGNGTVLWPSDVAVGVTPAEETPYPTVVSASSGGAVVVWTDNRDCTSCPPADYYTNAHVYGQRIDLSGSLLWPGGSSGKRISATATFCDGCGAGWGIADGNNGVIIPRLDATPQIQRLERVDGSGLPVWGNGDGVQLGTNGVPYLLSSGEVFLSWYDARNGTDDVYAQKIDPLGNVLWRAGGAPVSVTAGNQRYPYYVGDGVGGAIVWWSDDRNGTNDLYALRMGNANAPVAAIDVAGLVSFC